MADVLGFDQHHVEFGLNLLQKIRGPQAGIAAAHDRNVGTGVGLKRRRGAIALEPIPPQGGAGCLLGVRLRCRRCHHRILQSDSGALIRSGIQSAFQFDMKMSQPLLLFAPELTLESLAAHAFLY